MNSTDLYNAFREDVQDVALPYLFQDDEIWRYMDAAYKQFVRKTGGIPDFTSEATSVTVSTGDANVDLHPSILKFRTCTSLSTGKSVEIKNLQDMDASDYGRLQQVIRRNQSGPISWLIVGAEKNKGQVVSVPLEDDELLLSVFRLPLNTITGDGQNFEIDEMHQPYLLFYMKYLALLKQDAETFNLGKAADFMQLFDNYCEQARAEQERYKSKPRMTSYGGI